MNIDFGLVFAGVVALTAAVGVPLAYRQLRQAREAGQVEAIATVWRWFDDDAERGIRGQIHAARIRGELEEGQPLDRELRAVIQRMATSMDRVGLFLVNGLIEERYIFDRYAEVVITMWDLTGWVINEVRRQKGGGWRYFGPYPEDLLKQVRAPQPRRLQRLRRRLIGERPGNLYDRAKVYKAAHEPGAVYRSAQLDGPRPSAASGERG